MNDDDAYVGARLRRLRRSRGFTQMRLGAAIGVSFQQVQKYENGTNQMSVSRVRQIADALGVSPAMLIDAPAAAPETARLTRMFEGIKDIHKRRAILSYVEAMAG